MINVTLIGFGNVGSTLATLLLHSGYPMHLNIMDPNPDRHGAFLDIFHGLHLYDSKSLTINDHAQYLKADYIFHAAGVQNVHGAGRLSTTQLNIKLTRTLFEGFEFANNPYVIVIANPVDIVSYAVSRYSSIDPSRIIGTGTYLDSIRLSYYLSTLSHYSAHQIEALVVGEHGDSMVPIYSATKVNGDPISTLTEFSEDILETASELTKTAAFQIRETQPGTRYGVSKCAERIFEHLIQSRVMTISASILIDERHCNDLELNAPLFISLPVEIVKDKKPRIIDLKYSETEKNSLKVSAKLLAQHMPQQW